MLLKPYNLHFGVNSLFHYLCSSAIRHKIICTLTEEPENYLQGNCLVTMPWTFRERNNEFCTGDELKWLMGLTLLSEGLTGFWLCESLDSLLPISRWSTVYLTKFCTNMKEKDISANLQQKCLIFCSKVLLKVQHNMSLKVLLPWQHTRFQTSPILTAFLATYSVLFSYL